MCDRREKAEDYRDMSKDQKKLAQVIAGTVTGYFVSRGMEGRRVELGAKVRIRLWWLILVDIEVMLMAAKAVRVRLRVVEVKRWVGFQK